MAGLYNTTEHLFMCTQTDPNHTTLEPNEYINAKSPSMTQCMSSLRKNESLSWIRKMNN